MKLNSPFVKYSAQLFYTLLFFTISSGVMIVLSVGVILLNEIGIHLKKVGQFLPLLSGIFLYVYSLWLAKESSIAFSENSCFFFEAIIVSIKKSKMYLCFIPFIGKYFDPESKKEPDQTVVKTIDSQTRFDK